MNTPLQKQEQSMSRRKIIVIAITILALGALAIWQGLELALRLTSWSNTLRDIDRESGGPKQMERSKLFEKYFAK